MSTWEKLNDETSARVDMEHLGGDGERTVFEVAVREAVTGTRNDDKIVLALAAKFGGSWTRLSQWVERDEGMARTEWTTSFVRGRRAVPRRRGEVASRRAVPRRASTPVEVRSLVHVVASRLAEAAGRDEAAAGVGGSTGRGPSDREDWAVIAAQLHEAFRAARAVRDSKPGRAPVARAPGVDCPGCSDCQPERFPVR